MIKIILTTNLDLTSEESYNLDGISKELTRVGVIPQEGATIDLLTNEVMAYAPSFRPLFAPEHTLACHIYVGPLKGDSPDDFRRKRRVL